MLREPVGKLLKVVGDEEDQNDERQDNANAVANNKKRFIPRLKRLTCPVRQLFAIFLYKYRLFFDDGNTAFCELFLLVQQRRRCHLPLGFFQNSRKGSLISPLSQ